MNVPMILVRGHKAVEKFKWTLNTGIDKWTLNTEIDKWTLNTEIESEH